MPKRRANLENLWGEWYISFQKLLSSEMRKIDRRDSYLIDIHMRNQSSTGEPPTPKMTPVLSKNEFVSEDYDKEEPDWKKFSESLWLFGKAIGYVKGYFKVNFKSTIHQMGVGLMTENGIKFSTSLILDGSKSIKSADNSGLNIKSKSGELSEKFKELMKLKNELIFFETSKQSRTVKGLQERERLLKLIIENLQENTGSKNHNIYDNEFSLIRTQDLLLVLWMHWLNAWDTLSQLDVRQYYYKIMKLAFRASELDLAHIGFKGLVAKDALLMNNEEAIDKSFNKLEKEKRKSKGYAKANAFMINSNEVNQNSVNNDIKNLEESKRFQKILIALNYQFILNKSLKYSLHKLIK